METYAYIRGARTPSRVSRFLRALAVVLTLVAVLAGGIAVLTFRIANEIMRVPPKAVENFSTNILPTFSVVDFSSLDGQTSLSGWFFAAKGTPRGTVVMVHSDGTNRLEFGTGTAALYKALITKGFNVLSFDLRHSGDSGGRLTTYGYTEWQDVLAAVDYARRSTTTTGVVLYGFGSGAGAVLAAWDELPATGDDRKATSRLVSALPFTRDYILAMVLDSPGNSPDDFIRDAMKRLGTPTFLPLPWTVPIAVQMSAGAAQGYSLSALAARYQQPMLVMEVRASGAAHSLLLSERLRLHPDTTSAFEIPVPEGSTMFETDQKAYLEALQNFLDQYF